MKAPVPRKRTQRAYTASRTGRLVGSCTHTCGVAGLLSGLFADVAKDTSDTDTKSLCSEDSDLQVDLEYEVASNTDTDNPLDVSASSGTDVSLL